LNGDNPWDGILSAIAFAVRATVHTTTRATPSQLIFGRDTFSSSTYCRLAVYHAAEAAFDQYKQQTGKLKTHSYTYHVGQRGLIKAEQSAKYGQQFVIRTLHH
jgi:hypothetical protein